MGTQSSSRNVRTASRRRCLAALGVLLSSVIWMRLPCAPPALAETRGRFVIIVNPENPTRSVRREFLTAAFLKKVVHWGDGGLIRPVDLHPKASVRRHFSETILNRSVNAVRRYWQQRIFSGRDLPPPEFDSEADVVRYVRANPGAIGYVSAGAELEDVKVLAYE